jgi:GT2 family glycosyltransferase
MKIWVNIAFDTDCNKLGDKYNAFMNLIPKEDWACFLDHDAIFTTYNWYGQMMDYIKDYPDAGLFVCVTNRSGQKHQVINPIHSGVIKKDGLPIFCSEKNSHDMYYHRTVGSKLKWVTKATDITGIISSGMLMLTSKKVWEKVKFRPGFLGVDTGFHRDVRKAGYKIYRMEGLYIYHWYRDKIDDL